MRGDDKIYWAPLGIQRVVELFAMQFSLLHNCPTAVTVAPTTRDCLDPMALGTCRYCGEPLPKETT